MGVLNLLKHMLIICNSTLWIFFFYHLQHFLFIRSPPTHGNSGVYFYCSYIFLAKHHPWKQNLEHLHICTPEKIHSTNYHKWCRICLKISHVKGRGRFTRHTWMKQLKIFASGNCRPMQIPLQPHCYQSVSSLTLLPITVSPEFSSLNFLY